MVAVVPVVCVHQVTPPSLLKSSVPLAPPTQMQPAAAQAPSSGSPAGQYWAANSDTLVPLVRAVHVLPPSVVVWITPPLPTATPRLASWKATWLMVTVVGTLRFV